MKISINKPADLTAVDRRTIKRRLAPLEHEVDGRSHLYESADALSLIHGSAVYAGEQLDLGQERASLARAQRQLTETKHRQLCGELVPIDDVCQQADQAGRTVSDGFMAVPMRVANLLVGRTAREIENHRRRRKSDQVAGGLAQ